MGSKSPYWIKITYDRETYVIDLSQVTAFAYASNGKITFWLPGTISPVVINPQSNPEAHEKVLDYVEKATGYSLRESSK